MKISLNRVAGILAFGMAACAPAIGQSDKPLEEPFVKFPEGAYEYSVKLSPLDERVAKKNRLLQTVEVVSDGRLERRVNTWKTQGSEEADLSTTEDWRVGKTLIIQSPYGDWMNTMPVESVPGMDHPISAESFSLKRLGEYVGTENYGGTKCFHFIVESSVGGMGGASEKVKSEVWVNAKSGLPVAAKTEIFEYVFHFKKVTGGKLALPEKYGEMLNQASGSRSQN